MNHFAGEDLEFVTVKEEVEFNADEFTDDDTLDTSDAYASSSSVDAKIYKDAERAPLLFREKFFEFVSQEDGNRILKAACLLCHKKPNVYVASNRSSSNLMKHLQVFIIILANDSLDITFRSQFQFFSECI